MAFNQDNRYDFKALLGSMPPFAVGEIDRILAHLGISLYSKPHVLILVRWAILMGVALSEGAKDDDQIEAAVVASKAAFRRFMDGLSNGIIDAYGDTIIRREWLGRREEHVAAIGQFNELVDGRMNLYSHIISGKSPLANQLGTDRWGHLGIVVEQVFFVAVSSQDQSKLDTAQTHFLLESMCTIVDSLITGIGKSLEP